MSKFYFFLWFRWALRLSICSLILAAFFSIFTTLSIYFLQGSTHLNEEVYEALFEIFSFWFFIFWSFSILIALFRSLKFIFNTCIDGFELKLLSCDKRSVIESIGYGDLIKVWRKWLMLNIWLVGVFMISAVVFTSLFTAYNALFEWFNIFWLYAFILISGYFSLVIMIARCKKVKAVKC